MEEGQHLFLAIWLQGTAFEIVLKCFNETETSRFFEIVIG